MSLDIYFHLRNDYLDEDERVFDCNITHNLGKMADEAGIYDHVWGKSGIETAEELGNKIRLGVSRMIANPAVYRKFDSPNGWGIYDDFIPWLMELLRACEKYPDARVSYSR